MESLSGIIQGIVSGIGFLGAGSILKSNGGVEGLTTAAEIRVVGAIGAACGADYFSIAVLTTVFALLIMTILRIVEKQVIDRYFRKP